MTARKPKNQPIPGPLEQALKANEQSAKAAQRKASSKELTTPQLPADLEPFYAQQSKHNYGTCWQCGWARKTAGGLPNTGDAYWCDNCKCYLPIRHSRKDAAKIPLKTDSK